MTQKALGSSIRQNTETMNIDYYKSFLWPPQSMLEGIHFTELDYWSIDILPYKQKIEDDHWLTVYTIAELEKVRNFWFLNYQYTKGINSRETAAFQETNKANGFTQRSLLTVSEMIKNVCEHGNKNRLDSLTHIGYWITETGIVVGVRDEGVFYSKPETKELFEQKHRFESTKDNPSGLGIIGFYDDADFLEVVPPMNAIFAGFLLETKLKPGGKS